MIGSGGAVILGPDAVQFGGGADQSGLHHAIGVGVVGVKPVEAVQRGGADGEYEAGDGIPAAARQNVDRGGSARRIPEDVPAGEVMDGIERSGIVVIVRLANLALKLDVRTVGNVGE